MKDINLRVKKILSEVLSDESITIQDDTNLVSLMDSISLMLLIVSIEEEFGITLPETFWDNATLTNYKKILETIQCTLNSHKNS